MSMMLMWYASVVVVVVVVKGLIEKDNSCLLHHSI